MVGVVAAMLSMLVLEGGGALCASESGGELRQSHCGGQVVSASGPQQAPREQQQGGIVDVHQYSKQQGQVGIREQHRVTQDRGRWGKTISVCRGVRDLVSRDVGGSHAKLYTCDVARCDARRESHGYLQTSRDTVLTRDIAVTYRIALIYAVSLRLIVLIQSK